MPITARYADPEGTLIVAEIDGKTLHVPIDQANRHYARIIGESVEIAAYEPPPPEVPAIVSRYQGRQALRDAGLFDQVVALVNDPATAEEVRVRWEDLTVFERHSPLIAALAPSLGLSKAEVDALFVAAAAIE
ncbi:hypothetical protein [Algihabitans albus]|uniref:hypothetical protein n=1 Tax=Algihabitans albus TaxID=2164067 RepID=UPI000E5D4AF8|nr:hypothetical protein [Algihabitans albus]